MLQNLVICACVLRVGWVDSSSVYVKWEQARLFLLVPKVGGVVLKIVAAPTD